MATASTTQKPPAKPQPEPASGGGKVWLPYAIAIGSQIPLLIFYFFHLWDRGPHYHFFPLAILAVVAIAWIRWPREEKMPFHRSSWSDCLLILGLLAGILAAIFLEPWFAAACTMFVVASLLARTVDPETGRGMWVVSLPLFVALMLPNNWDMGLITLLQRYSAIFTSQMLDLIGMGHHMPGTVIQIPGKEAYGIEEACSGVMSFFTLLFVAMVFIVWNRRPWFRASLLILSAVFWAMFMNTVRIFMIPFADWTAGIDLANGFAHHLLGWIVLVIGILLLLSTDQFLMFLFGPVEETTGRAGPFGNFLTKIWNGMVSGSAETAEEESKRKRRRRRKPMSAFGKSMVWIAAGILALGGLVQLTGTFQSFGLRKLPPGFFSGDVTVPFSKNDLADTSEWEIVPDSYNPEDRKKGSDLGLRTDSWLYRSKFSGLTASASFDQTFPGWHELTICYRNQGWELPAGKRIRRTEKTGSMDWPYIEASFVKDTGENGFLLFSFFDAYGEPLDAPVEWNTINSFFYRARNRLNGRIRSQLFTGEAYQCQVFSSSFREYDEQAKEDLKENFLLLREQMRRKFMEKRDIDESDSPANNSPDDNSADSPQPPEGTRP